MVKIRLHEVYRKKLAEKAGYRECVYLSIMGRCPFMTEKQWQKWSKKQEWCFSREYVNCPIFQGAVFSSVMSTIGRDHEQPVEEIIEGLLKKKGF